MAEIVDPRMSSLATIIDDFHEQVGAIERPRSYIGISILGHPCERWLWLNFRWILQERFSGRMRRLFRRGQEEEHVVVRDLVCAGLSVEEALEKQVRLYFGSFIAGHPDGYVLGVPEAPKTPHLLEIKTSNDKSFRELQKKGVQEAKPMHYIQMQCGMKGKKFTRALYIAVNKNDDTYYIERVDYDKACADAAIERGKRIALDDRIPAPLSSDPTWYQCQWCAAHNFCHGTKTIEAQHLSCRSCAHATPKQNSTWVCELCEQTIPEKVQRQGCPAHVLHPDVVSWEMNMKKNTKTQACYIINGEEFMNGEGCWESKKLLEHFYG